jgi:acetyl esterase/lipase
MAARYIYRSVAASRVEIAQAFGRDASHRLRARPSSAILRHRWSPAAFHDPDPRVERNVVFAVVPETSRQLLADIWYPPSATPASGLAFLFFHGSGWHMSDKGVGMDPTFRHLVAQGYVVMDVAYRLAPDADLIGMVGDAKRAIVWMKANGSRYGATSDRIVISGASAGGQIALLAAYSSGEPELTPAELMGADTSVLGVVSYYGPTDMRAFVNHEVGALIKSGVRATRKIPLTDPKTHLPTGPMTLEQMMFNVMGGMPEDVPHAYDLAAVKSHITPRTPPTLFFQGECDSFVQTQAVRNLVNALRAAEVPVVYVEFPDTDHGFDIASAFTTFGGMHLPIESQFAPPSQAALYDLDRFLAVLAAR